jgi:hypothetical protein
LAGSDGQNASVGVDELDVMSNILYGADGKESENSLAGVKSRLPFSMPFDLIQLNFLGD